MLLEKKILCFDKDAFKFDFGLFYKEVHHLVSFPGERIDVLDNFSNPFSIWRHGGFCFLELLCPQKLVYWFLVLGNENDFQRQNICFSCFSGIESAMLKADSLRIRS